MEVVPSSATWEHAILCCQGHTYHIKFRAEDDPDESDAMCVCKNGGTVVP
jgi:hypothetical protein